jgi:hypothetical protein
LQTTLGGSNQLMAWQYYFGDKIPGRKEDLSSFTKLVVKAKSSQDLSFTVSLINTDAQSFSTIVQAGAEFTEIMIPLNKLQLDSMLLLPRPYPGFQPLWFHASSTKPFDIKNIEKLEIRFNREGLSTGNVSLEIASVWLQ